jgi:hypothetical protein
MYVFLFVLAPLAIVIAWALARDRRRRRHAHGADIQVDVKSAKGRATGWMLRITQDEQGGLTEAFADARVDRDLPRPRRVLASQPLRSRSSSPTDIGQFYRPLRIGNQSRQ